MNFRYESPWAFSLLLLVLVIFMWRWLRSGPAITLPGTEEMQRAHSLRVWLRGVPHVVRALALTCLVFAIARPQTLTGRVETSREGVAIQLVIDRSASMGAPMELDGRSIERLEVVKRVLRDFLLGNGKELKGRPDDLVGLIVFSGYADTLAPLVHNHQAIIQLAEGTQLAPASLPEGGTAIGDALALAAARLRNAEEQIKRLSTANQRPEFTIKSKIIVLLTDGEHNRGEVLPEQAAQLAAEWGIKIYSIGIGGTGGFVTIRGPAGERIPIRDHVDERTLTAIAQRTGGRYWNARTADTMRDVYAEIDRLEKTTVQSRKTTVYEERFLPWATYALFLLGIEALLASTVFRRLP
jgi:Ca-activated chloride channel family protein